MIINLIILLLIVFLLVILSMIWPPDSPWAPWWATNKKVAKKACELVAINSKDIIYELGSGDATCLITAAKDFGAKGVGIEIDPLRFIISKVKITTSGVSDRIKIIKGNFFRQNLSEATAVFVYLVPKTLEKLKPKLLKELNPGTKIISFRYKIKMPLFKEDKVNRIYFYIL